MVWFRTHREEERTISEGRSKEMALTIQKIELRLDALEQNFKSLRGLVNKKLYKEDDIDDIGGRETKKSQYQDGFDIFRM